MTSSRSSGPNSRHQGRFAARRGSFVFCILEVLLSLALLAASQTSLAQEPTVSMAAPHNDAAIHVTSKAGFTLKSEERVTFAKSIPEGGFLLATNIKGGASFLYKLGPTGSVIWHIDLLEHSFVRSGGPATGGKFWIGGFLGDNDSDSIQFANSVDGGLSAPSKIAVGKSWRGLNCATEYDGRYIQAATVDSLDEYFRLEVPAVSMTNSMGTRLWETLFPFEGGRRIQKPPGDLLNCEGVVVTSDQHILAAQPISVFPDVTSEADIKREIASGANGRTSALVVALDLTGREIAHFRHDDVVDPLLVERPGGAILIESSWMKPGLHSAATVDHLLHLYSLDSHLRNTAQPLVIADSYFDRVSAAYVTEVNDLLIAAWSGTTCAPYMQYISLSKRHISRKVSADGPYCAGEYWFGRGVTPNQPLLIVQGKDGVYVERLRVPD
jgi:hypothetical protein